MRTITKMQNRLSLFFLFFLPLYLVAQSPENMAKEYLRATQFAPEDYAELRLQSHYNSEHNGVSHYHFQQYYQNIAVQNAILSLHIQSGKIIHTGNRFTKHITQHSESHQPQITATQALQVALKEMNITTDKLKIHRQVSPHHLIFKQGAYAFKNPIVTLKWFSQNDKVSLTWAVKVQSQDQTQYKTIFVDATNQGILDQFNHILHCQFGNGNFLATQTCTDHEHQHTTSMTNLMVTDNANYQVWEYPLQSPKDGERTLTGTGIADAAASPFGWHDTDGQVGAEFDITRGNNVHAYINQGSEPQGSGSCFFTAPFNEDWEPNEYADASAIQLFYSCNMMHDMAYRYGFNEVAGNYQENNYGNGGLGGDYVIARSQISTQANNAEFTIDPDGQNSTMRMFLWNRMGLLTVNEPFSLAGIYETRAAQFGNGITNTPVTGKVVIAKDASNNPTLACSAIVNGDEVSGNIAMVDRGVCDYSQKVLNAQNAGAIAVIVCSVDGGTFNEMGVGCCGAQVSIPSVLIPYNDCQVLRQFAGSGLDVSLVQPQNMGPENLDGALDNTITSHEYAHGISVRLTGGPNNANCLNNDEQMGEGWSDFFALAMTAKSGEDGSEARGMSTYVLGQETDGLGIRRFPYSTNFQINQQTYHDVIASTRPHPVGEVWASILWDLYWKMVEEYGFDEDVINGTGGNNLAIQLVMDGMKLQPCSPGFVDGRDAILMADQMNNNGDNQCLIWEVFAQRGLGVDASQGSANNRNDGRESYDLIPSCLKELKISKSMTPLIEAGENFEVTLTVNNDLSTLVEGVIVTDIIPENAEFVQVLTNTTFEQNGNMLSFELGNMATGSEISITYRLAASPDFLSVLKYLDNAENGDGDWDFEVLRGSNIWVLDGGQTWSGDNAWYAPAIAEEADFTMELIEDQLITNENTALRFYHWYDTEWGNDGGIVEVSTDGGNIWETVEDNYFRNGYETVLSFFTFNVPKIPAFAGDGDSFRASYVDLSDYVGETIKVRFRFGHDTETSGNENGIGWYVDDIELLEVFNYNSEACVSAIDAATVCTEASGRGTIVNSDVQVNVPAVLENLSVAIYPNPTNEVLNINIQTNQSQTLTASLLSVDGRVLKEATQYIYQQGGFTWNTANLASGFYFVRIATGSGVMVEKVVVE